LSGRLRGLPERLKPPALLLCLDAIWRQLEGPLRRRCVLVDEAWLLMREPAGARFLFRLAKSSRKRWCGLTAITQDAPDLLGSELGQAVVSNAATQLLLRQGAPRGCAIRQGKGSAESYPFSLTTVSGPARAFRITKRARSEPWQFSVLVVGGRSPDRRLR